MAKVSPNPIINLDQDWGSDVSYNNLPFSGSSIQSFIKGYLSDIAHAAYFDPNTYTMYWFASDADLQAWRIDNTSVNPIYSTVLSFANDLWRVYLINNNNTTNINTSSNAEALNLSVNFDVQWKTLSDSSWTSMNQGVYVTVSVDVGATGQYTAVSDKKFYSAGSTVSIDVMPFLQSGPNRVKLAFIAEENESAIATLTYTINVSEMYIELMNNTWYKPIVEGGDASSYKLGGFKIIGSLNKTLVLDIYSGDSKVTTFTKIIGSTVYDSVPYNYTQNEGLDFSELNLNSGIYRVVAYLRSGTLESLPIQYNIIYIAASDVSTAQLVCFNEITEFVYNYTNATLCQYSIYNKGVTTADPHVLVNILVGTNPTAIINDTFSGIETETAHPLVCQVDWISDSMLEQSVQFTMTFGNQQTAIRPLNNTFAFPPQPGYAFYMNSASRLNSNLNNTKLINIVGNTEYTPTWTRLSWLDGIDGWTEDDTGRACLLIPARSYMTLPHTEYQMLNPTQLGETFEICFKITNVSDYDEDIITIATGRDLPENSVSQDFRGIRIKPNKIVVHSSLDATTNDTLRGTNFEDEKIIHLVISWYPNYGGENNRNLCTGYINGCKNFQFEYSNQAVWNIPTSLIIGSQKSDVAIYFIRKYDTVLSDTAVLSNYINSLQYIPERQALYDLLWSVTDGAHTNIDYEAVKNHNYNYFVLEMLNGATVPSAANGWSSTSSSVRSNLEMHYGEHPEWDWKIYNVETSGQGTTSMNYYRWNLRWRIDKTDSTKKVPVSQSATRSTLNNSYIYEWSTPINSKTVYFDGMSNSIGNHPAVKRITAKINMASSMQSHKIGATRAYDVLHSAVVGNNPAQAASQTDGNPIPTVTVYEYPAYGFVYNPVEDSYSYIGLFTIGPDKGDKPTFGYGYEAEDGYVVEDSLITLEGTDHSQRLAQFSYPYKTDADLSVTGNTGNVVYDIDEECLSINLGDGTVEKAWEVGNCYGLETSKGKTWTAAETETYAALVKAKLDEEWQPAYDVAYSNNVLIFPIALGTYGDTVSATINAINDKSEIVVNGITTNNLNVFRTTQYNNRLTYADMQFWIEGEYKLYYYDVPTDQYLTDGVNLVTKYGINTSEKTLQQINDEIIAARCADFKINAPNYWNIQDSLFHFVFCMLFGATDNFAKNSYPYKMKSLSDGGKWCWRQDDLDTIFDIDNSGGQTKPYWIEFEDANNGTSYFAGGNSFFWNVLYKAYYNEIKTMGRNVLNAMSADAGGTNVFDGATAFINKYFWNNAQNYFPQSAYNADGTFKYERAWIANGQNVPPLTQSLGNHYSAEQLWVRNRLVYMASAFGAGAFYAVDDIRLGRISFRASGAVNLALTPIINMYPTYGLGQQYQTLPRTNAGTTQNISFSGGNDTTVYIAATNYLSSIGNLKDLVLTTLSNLTIDAKKLVTFAIGVEEAETLISPAVYYTQEEIDDATAAYTSDDVANLTEEEQIAWLEEHPAYGKTVDDIKTPAVIEQNVTTNVPGLIFPNNYCLETIDARNTESLTGTLDLSNCKRLKTCYFEGSNLNSVILPRGVKIETLHLPESTTAISLRYLKYLTDLQLPEDLSNITVLHIESCDNQNAINILTDIFNTENNKLQYVRLVSPNIEDGTSNTMKMLAYIASAGTYYGVSSSGSPDSSAVPLIDLKMNITSGVYEADLENLEMNTPTQYGETNLVISNSVAVRGLNLIWDPVKIYQPFADPEVKRVAISHWGDGYGILKSNLPSITTVYIYFKSNTLIKTFDELQYFTGLTEIYGVTAGDNGAFLGCSNLESVTLPSTVVALGHNAFNGCAKLSSINLENIKTTGRWALRSTAITNVNMPNLTSLGADTFYNCSSLISVTSLGEITTIPDASSSGYGVFRGCYNLESVVLPNTLTTVGSYALAGITKLTNCNLPESLRVVGSGAFWNSSIDNVVYLPNLTYIGNQAFRGTKITSITSLGNITSFTGGTDSGSGVFRDCSLLTSVTLPSNFVSIGGYGFGNCKALTEINLPNTLTTINGYAFYGCTGLVNLSIPTSVTSIGAFAFSGCSNLSTVLNLPNLTTLGDAAFFGTKITEVTSLGNITALAGGTTWTNGTFRNCSLLSTVVLPSTITSIAANVFAGTPVQYLTIEATTPPSLNTTGITSESYFDNNIKTIFVPNTSIDAYKTATNWNRYYAYFKAIGTSKWSMTYPYVDKVFPSTNRLVTWSSGGYHPYSTDYVSIPSTCTTIRYRANLLSQKYQIGGGVQTVSVQFYDSSKNCIYYDDQYLYENTNLEVPEGSAYIRIALIPDASGLTNRHAYIWDVTNDDCLWPIRTEVQE